MRTDQDEDEDKVNISIIAAISDYDLCPEHTCIDLDFSPQDWQSNSMDVRHIRGSAWFPRMTGPMKLMLQSKDSNAFPQGFGHASPAQWSESEHGNGPLPRKKKGLHRR